MNDQQVAVEFALRSAGVKRLTVLRDAILSTPWILELPATWKKAGESARDYTEALKLLKSRLEKAHQTGVWLRTVVRPDSRHDGAEEPEEFQIEQDLERLLEISQRLLHSATPDRKGGRPEELGTFQLGLWVYGHLERHEVAQHKRLGLLKELLLAIGLEKATANGTTRSVRNWVKDRKLKQPQPSS